MCTGRVSSTGFLPEIPRASKYRDTLSSSTVPVPPDETLFRRHGAPERYEEDDFYWADRDLPKSQTLPDSDLLKAIHTYASDYYHRATVDKGQFDFYSMDETALLAIGILLEEAANHSLGATGDLAFVEGQEVAAEEPEVTHQDESSSQISSRGSSVAVVAPKAKRRRKRRKIQETSS